MFSNLLKRILSFIRSIRNPRFRSEILTRIEYKDRHYQGTTYTRLNRFPVLFSQCELVLKHITKPQIISFGCSSGEEVFTLAQYMPCAKITGVDINKWCLKQCNKKSTNKNLFFINRISQEYDRLNSVDAIFCLAVFQRAENRINNFIKIDKGLTFQKFEEEMSILDKKLKVGGLLFIDHCDFSFEDTYIASNYISFEFENSKRFRDRPLYGKNNEIISMQHWLDRVFIKQKDQ